MPAARGDRNRLPQLDRHDLVRLFRDLEEDRIATARTLILSRHRKQMPRGTRGEMGVIRGKIARRRGHQPIRWVGVMDDKARRVGTGGGMSHVWTGGWGEGYQGVRVGGLRGC